MILQFVRFHHRSQRGPDVGFPKMIRARFHIKLQGLAFFSPDSDFFSKILPRGLSLKHSLRLMWFCRECNGIFP